MKISPDTALEEIVSLNSRTGSWFVLAQERIDLFADATDDHQWIHVDPERARLGTYGTTVAHGFLLLSLLPSLAGEILHLTGFSSVLNYGLDRVRFPGPAPANSRIRDRLVIDGAERAAHGVLLKVTHTIEVEGLSRPACVAQQLRLLVP